MRRCLIWKGKRPETVLPNASDFALKEFTMKVGILALIFSGCLISIVPSLSFEASGIPSKSAGRPIQTDLSRSTKGAKYCVAGDIHAAANNEKDAVIADSAVHCTNRIEGRHGEDAPESPAGGKNFERTSTN